MKILRSERRSRKSSPISSARTNWRLVKQDQSVVKAINCSLNGTGKKSNCCRKHQSFSSAKVSKAEFYSVTLLRVQSTHLSTVVTTKTSSGAKRDSSGSFGYFLASWFPD